MTPKEKAIELYNKMYDFSIFDESAKQCALIAVDEMIEIYVSACVAMGMSKEDAEKQESKYLQEVKQEIEAL
jgi:ArsR family metal-binding transcriptional regulator